MIAPANTGNDNNNNIAVTNRDQTKRERRSKVRPGARMLIMVVRKLVAPNMEDKPAKCKLKITKSTEPPECA